jgi:hypothetical protein
MTALGHITRGRKAFPLLQERFHTTKTLSGHPGRVVLGAAQTAQRQCWGKRNVHCARNCQLAPVSSGVTTL